MKGITHIILNAKDKGSYLKVFKTLNLFGPIEAIVMADILDKFEYFAGRNMLTDDEEFFITQRQQRERLILGQYQLTSALNNLEKYGLISRKRKGVPPKHYYKINEEKLEYIFKYRLVCENEFIKKINPKFWKSKVLEIKSLSFGKSKVLCIENQNIVVLKTSTILRRLYKENIKGDYKEGEPFLPSSSKTTPTQSELDISPQQNNTSTENKSNPNPETKSSTLKRTSKPGRKIPRDCYRASRRFYHDLKNKGVRKQFPKKIINDGAAVLDKLVRLDEYDLQDEIIPALNWAMEDDFWSRNIQSLNTLRNKGKNGNTKFANMYANYSSERISKNKTKINGGRIQFGGVDARDPSIDARIKVKVTSRSKRNRGK